jgi:hypothetical protein
VIIGEAASGITDPQDDPGSDEGEAASGKKASRVLPKIVIFL